MQLRITFGPAWEPLDGARRLTNMSTGRLGVQIANAFTDAGWNVHCLRGEGATYGGALHTREVESFTTNDDLAEKLERIGRLRRVDAVFHAAALCDYRIARVTNAAGEDVRSAKIATRDGRLLLELEPATKVLPSLRQWFPQARLVGWKYELAGGRNDAFSKAWRQLRECATDACVLNGAAYGEGFAVCRPDGSVRACSGPTRLAEALLAWLAEEEPSTRSVSGLESRDRTLARRTRPRSSPGLGILEAVSRVEAVVPA
ncbi:MAG: DNA/pantothenate metabolism flavoprotein domain protein [Verrucomicrobiales bacterium]|nr:DNA/pantothenate metabolism flavoprotein domain protein [Verrucomicrobiales bacterium]